MWDEEKIDPSGPVKAHQLCVWDEGGWKVGDETCGWWIVDRFGSSLLFNSWLVGGEDIVSCYIHLI
jgi:hypothetical protein